MRCLTSTETVRLIRDGEKGGGGMEVGRERDDIPIATLSPTRMTPALRWAAMRAVLMFHKNIVRDKVTRRYPQTTTFEVK